MRRRLFHGLILAGLGSLQTGCTPIGLKPTPTTVESETSSSDVARDLLSSGNDKADGGDLRVQLQFDVVRVDFPKSESRPSAKVWNHVDEMRIPPALASLLVKNGLRIGAASDDSWPALSALFAEDGAAVNRTQTWIEPGLPMWLALGPFATSESVFVFPEDGAMVGYTFEGGTKCLRVDYEALPTNPPTVNLRVSPEIHMQEGPPRWVSSGRDYQLMRSAEHHTFQGLINDWTLAENEYLVIGPDPGTDLAHRLGARFLTGSDAGVETDVVICIKPRLFRMEDKGR